MQGTVKWFDTKKGYGFVTGSEGKEHFVHHSSITMDGFRHLNEGDFVNFELGAGKDGREQAVNIKPILTMKMVKDSLKEENFHVETMKDAYGVTMYQVADQNNVIQSGEQGMSFLELAAFTGYDTEGLVGYNGGTTIMRVEVSELLKALSEHNKTGKGYQIHLNSADLDGKSARNIGVEISDIYFTECSTLKNTMILSFGNMNKKPIGKSEDGTDLYPMEINSNIFIDINQIEAIEDVEDFADWFSIPSSKVFNVYMLPEDDKLSGNRNVLTVGFIE